MLARSSITAIPKKVSVPITKQNTQRRFSTIARNAKISVRTTSIPAFNVNTKINKVVINKPVFSTVSANQFVRFNATTAEGSYEMIIVDKKDNGVAVVTLNRPKALNALCNQLLTELNAAFTALDKDNKVGCIILTGSQKAFAAGADIKEMAPKTFADNYKDGLFNVTDNFRNIKKPIIAAVSGYALGGGCELAMMCDIVIASDSAKFGQPEITLGTIPGIGGTQRLTQAIGKSKAMEIILTGKSLDAKQAEAAGLVARVVPDAQLLESAMETAAKIASFSKPVVAMAKECVNKAMDVGLTEGLHFERRVFYSTFSLNDQKAGMKAFVNKEKPTWSDS